MNPGCIGSRRATFTPKIVAEVPVTVRKRLTFVCKGPGEVIWTGQNAEEAIVFCAENDHTEVEWISPTGLWLLKTFGPSQKERCTYG